MRASLRARRGRCRPGLAHPGLVRPGSVRRVRRATVPLASRDPRRAAARPPGLPGPGRRSPDLRWPRRPGHPGRVSPPGQSGSASIGVIGGSGFYEFLDDAAEIDVATPFGPPSDRLTIGTIAGRSVAFLPRHGRDHQVPAAPHSLPANLWALRSVGVRQVLAPSAVGSLTAACGPGTLVIPDQIVDRTSEPRADLLRRGRRGAHRVRRPVLPGRPVRRRRVRPGRRLAAGAGQERSW